MSRPFRPGEHRGNLYQHHASRLMARGDYFHVNGPWDRHGAVLTCTPTAEGSYLCLVRGTGNKRVR